MARLIIEVPDKELGIEIGDKFEDFFNRICAEITVRLNHNEELVCGTLEYETATILRKSFQNGVLLPTDATNGDAIKAMFPNIDKYKNTLLEDGRKNVLFDDDWWNAPYKVGSEVDNGNDD